MTFNTKIRSWIEPVKWILGADIDNTYKPLLDASDENFISNPSRTWLLQNGTDGDIMISIDGGADMHIPVFKGAATVIDLMTNKPIPGGSNTIPVGTVVSVTALSTANAAFNGAGFTDPTTGAVFLTAFYGR